MNRVFVSGGPDHSLPAVLLSTIMLICTVLVSTTEEGTSGIVISDCWLCVSCRTGAALISLVDGGGEWYS